MARYPTQDKGLERTKTEGKATARLRTGEA